jgi:hypothetical protein
VLLHPDPSVGSESCQFGWHVRYHVMDGRVQGGGCGILELGIHFLLMLNSLRDWERAYLHFDCIYHVTCALRLQYIFSLHIASHIVSTIFLRPIFLCLCLDTYFGVFFRFNFSVPALSHRDATLAVTLWKEGIMW